MRKDNPACFECPRGRDGLHWWKRDETTMQATCQCCRLTLTKQDTAEVYGPFDREKIDAR